MIRQAIKEQLKRVLKETGYGNIEPEVLATTDDSFGDFFSNVALKIFQTQTSKRPLEIAKEIEAKLGKISKDFSASSAANGLLNFRLNPQFLQTNLQKIIKENEDFGKNNFFKAKKARVEFVSANPTGPLHIGNARGGPLGDTIAAILEANGYSVIREYLHNNIGNQVDNLGQSLMNIKNGGRLQDQEYKGEYLLELADDLPLHVNTAEKAGNWAVEKMLKEILKDLEQMGIKYDKIYQESEFAEGKTKEVLEKLRKKGFLKEKDGATWLATNDEFLKDREAVVIRSNGQPTYFGNDIAYHDLKFAEKSDLVIDELGSGHDGHIPKLKSVISALGHDVERFKVVVHQNVRVKKGGEVVKMSKRAGNVVTAKEVLDQIGKDAFRYFLLAHDASTHMDLDITEASKKSSENPVYYIQYAHARCANILKKAKEQGFRVQNFGKGDLSLLNQTWELRLIKKLLKLPDLVQDLAGNFSVHLIARYAFDSADTFHKFYENVRVVTDDRKLSEARLQLIVATRIVLSNTLKLMGISAPERM